MVLKTQYGINAHPPSTKRRDLGVGEEKLKCVDGGGGEEKQNNCEIVRIEKREHQIFPLQTMN